WAAGQGLFSGDAEQTAALFQGLTSHWPRVLFCSSLFLLATMACVGRGVERGIEASLRLTMPALLVLLLILVGHGMVRGDFVGSLPFLFDPDFSRLGVDGLLVALGHAFFTLGVGAAAMMIYGAYVPPQV